MDIKLKKWKSIISFTAFFIGTTLLLSGVLDLLQEIRWQGPAELMSILKTDDYQTTDEFRRFIESRLETFLVMADSRETESPSGGESAELISETAEEWWDFAYSTNYYNDYYISPEDIHNAVKDDKNLLYTVIRDGDILYTNAEGYELDGGALPEGYNFLLYFDGEKVRIVKDGKEEEIYGDGYYREGSKWYVPGYRNFTVSGEMQKTRVWMAAAKEPLLYTVTGYQTKGYQYSDNRLYWIKQRISEVKRNVKADFAGLAAGCLTLCLYLLLRADKKHADRFLAKLTRKAVFEVKLAAFAAALILPVTLWSARNRAWLSWDTFKMIWQETNLVTAVEETGGWHFVFGKGFAVCLFWAVWTCLNDLKYNKEEWKHSICYRFYTAKKMQCSMAKRMLLRYLPAFAAVVYLAAAVTVSVITGSAGSAVSSVLLTAGVLLLTVTQAFYLKKLNQDALALETLGERIGKIREGDYGTAEETQADSELQVILTQLEDIRRGMGQAVDEQMKSERMKVELIANVSHDIKTPLTSIISYIQFLKEETGLPPHVQDYIRILDEKAFRLKNMVQDVFIVSKAASGELPIHLEALDYGKLLRQTIGEMEEQMNASGLYFKTDIPEEPVMIQADGPRMYRVFQNLIQNAIKYSLRGSRVYIALKVEEGTALASIKNTSMAEVDPGKQYAERFCRGDKSRTDGGSGLGLSIAQSFTEACGGKFVLKIDADLFTVTISFPTI